MFPPSLIRHRTRPFHWKSRLVAGVLAAGDISCWSGTMSELLNAKAASCAADVLLWEILRIDDLDTSVRLVEHVSVPSALSVFPFERISTLENVDFDSAIRPLENNLCTQRDRYSCHLFTFKNHWHPASYGRHQGAIFRSRPSRRLRSSKSPQMPDSNSCY